MIRLSACETSSRACGLCTSLLQTITMAPDLLLLVLCIGILCTTHMSLVGGLQCYSCKASGINEMDANIRCLEKAYLESCDEFYNYYNDVEEELYDYYYNFGSEEGDGQDAAGQEVNMLGAVEGELVPAERGLNDDFRAAGSVNTVNTGSQPRLNQQPQKYTRQPKVQRIQHPPGVVPPGVAHASRLQIRKKRRTTKVHSSSKNSSADNENGSRSRRNSKQSDESDEDDDEQYYDYYDSYSEEEEDESRGKHRGRGRAQNGSRGGRGHRGRGGRGRGKGRSRKDSSEYEYEYYEDEETTPAPVATTDAELVTTAKPPAKPEHYCYSVTEKSGWETYTVEKGCKKILYCKDSLANKPDWAHPWNFCCDRSRCNVKLVKDKPQRVFGMGCRRTDDCIQGHNSRPVCPHFFKACPRISRTLVKMECRAQTRTMASVKGGLKYRAGKEKKCYCSKGYYPKGPICTSGAASLIVPKMAAALVFITQVALRWSFLL